MALQLSLFLSHRNIRILLFVTLYICIYGLCKYCFSVIITLADWFFIARKLDLLTFILSADDVLAYYTNRTKFAPIQLKLINFPMIFLHTNVRAIERMKHAENLLVFFLLPNASPGQARRYCIIATFQYLYVFSSELSRLYN